ncbi:maleylpyruvate isomerase N-terminal domain-containing protein [Streptomyces adustus]
MTRAGLESARVSTVQLADIVLQVDESAWELPSACPGWRVIDVIAHLGALAHEAVEPPHARPLVAEEPRALPRPAGRRATRLEP